MKGTLVLIPSLLGNHDPILSHPPAVIDRVRTIEYFAVEKLPSAVHFLKRIDHPIPEFKLQFYQLDKRVQAEQLNDIVRILEQGKDVGVLSEAGCPGVADPGGELVWMCHLRGIEVLPLVGPSAILLSVMTTGLNGQSFGFNGYLPVNSDQRSLRIRELQNRSAREQQTQVFIEAPHRNTELLQAMMQELNPETRLAVCWNLMIEDQWIRSKPVSAWNVNTVPENFDQKPAMFLFLSAGFESNRQDSGQNQSQNTKKRRSGKPRPYRK
jgi:16S rRNA (cytidine1402-2'-O)-methyltransferase